MLFGRSRPELAVYRERRPEIARVDIDQLLSELDAPAASGLHADPARVPTETPPTETEEGQ